MGKGHGLCSSHTHPQVSSTISMCVCTCMHVGTCVHAWVQVHACACVWCVDSLEVLMAHHALDTAVVKVSGSFRACQHQPASKQGWVCKDQSAKVVGDSLEACQHTHVTCEHTIAQTRKLSMCAPPGTECSADSRMQNRQDSRMQNRQDSRMQNKQYSRIRYSREQYRQYSRMQYRQQTAAHNPSMQRVMVVASSKAEPG